MCSKNKTMKIMPILTSTILMLINPLIMKKLRYPEEMRWFHPFVVMKCDEEKKKRKTKKRQVFFYDCKTMKRRILCFLKANSRHSLKFFILKLFSRIIVMLGGEHYFNDCVMNCLSWKESSYKLCYNYFALKSLLIGLLSFQIIGPQF